MIQTHPNTFYVTTQYYNNFQAWKLPTWPTNWPVNNWLHLQPPPLHRLTNPIWTVRRSRLTILVDKTSSPQSATTGTTAANGCFSWPPGACGAAWARRWPSATFGMTCMRPAWPAWTCRWRTLPHSPTRSSAPSGRPWRPFGSARSGAKM